MLVDRDWYVRFMKVARVIITKGKFKVATSTHIWVEWLGHPGETSGLPRHLEKLVLAQGDPGGPVRSPYGMLPRIKGIIRYFMPRNFCVQP